MISESVFRFDAEIYMVISRNSKGGPCKAGTEKWNVHTRSINLVMPSAFIKMDFYTQMHGFERLFIKKPTNGQGILLWGSATAEKLVPFRCASNFKPFMFLKATILQLLSFLWGENNQDRTRKFVETVVLWTSDTQQLVPRPIFWDVGSIIFSLLFCISTDDFWQNHETCSTKHC